MKKIGKKLIFAGVVLLIGPFFGFTIRGQQNASYGAGAMLGIIALAIGVIFISLKKES